MPYPLQSVAVAGATGNTGPTVVKALIDAGFKVTALTRSASKIQAIAGLDINIVEVDYLSHESLVSALQGIDAVVVCGVGMFVHLIISTSLILITDKFPGSPNKQT